MEWAASKAGLIPANDEDAMAMRMVVGEKYLNRKRTIKRKNKFLFQKH